MQWPGTAFQASTELLCPVSALGRQKRHVKPKQRNLDGSKKRWWHMPEKMGRGKDRAGVRA